MIYTDIFDEAIIPDELTEEDIKNLKLFDWEPQRALTAQTCYLSGEKINMFQHAFKGCALVPIWRTNDFAVITRWATEQAIIIHKLKGNIS